MELLLSIAIGVTAAAGIYLILRLRAFPVIVGLSMVTYSVNLFLFASGRLVLDLPPVLSPDRTDYADPLPEALVLTAIVISFGMTALIVLMSLAAFIEKGDDRIDMTDRGSAPRAAPPGAAEAGSEGAGRTAP
jgi:multicomponent K+:H+ antiporter subunit C